MVGPLTSNDSLYRLPSKPRPYDAGGDGGRGLSHVCMERLAYVPTLPEVMRGKEPTTAACRRCRKAGQGSGRLLLARTLPLNQ